MALGSAGALGWTGTLDWADGAGAGAGAAGTAVATDAGAGASAGAAGAAGSSDPRFDEHATNRGIVTNNIPTIATNSFEFILMSDPSLIECLAKFSAGNMYRRHTQQICSIPKSRCSEFRFPGVKRTAAF
jgi:hypothetical protein